MPLNTSVLRQVEAQYSTPADLSVNEASLVSAINAVLGMSNVRERHRRQLVDTAVWKYTEAAGMTPHPKYNLRYVTDGARNLKLPTPVQHEHVWERSWIVSRLLEGLPWSEDDLKTFLAAHAVGCTVTQKEHALLEPGDGWQRYKQAGVPVWDRQMQSYLQVGRPTPAIAAAVDEPPATSPALRLDLSQLIDDRATTTAPYLHSLVRSARFMSAVSVPAVKEDGHPSAYFRIHDTLLDRRSAAVAYPHWSGKVDFALRYDQVPETLRGLGVSELRNAKHSVTCRVTDQASLETAEELLFLALESLRETSAGT